MTNLILKIGMHVFCLSKEMCMKRYYERWRDHYFNVVLYILIHFFTISIFWFCVKGFRVKVDLSSSEAWCEPFSSFYILYRCLNFSHFMASWKQTWQECSLGGTVYDFSADRKFNIVARANSVFLLVEISDLWYCKNAH